MYIPWLPPNIEVKLDKHQTCYGNNMEGVTEWSGATFRNYLLICETEKLKCLPFIFVVQYLYLGKHKHNVTTLKRW